VPTGDLHILVADPDHRRGALFRDLDVVRGVALHRDVLDPVDPVGDIVEVVAAGDRAEDPVPKLAPEVVVDPFGDPKVAVVEDLDVDDVVVDRLGG